jgi:hypothetical protein
MRIFGFDLLPYPEHLDHLKVITASTATPGR